MIGDTISGVDIDYGSVSLSVDTGAIDERQSKRFDEKQIGSSVMIYSRSL